MKTDNRIRGTEALEYVESRLEYPLDTLLKFPKFFLIETTNICNARCVMCGIDFEKKKKQVMTDELFSKLADEIGKHSDHVEKVMLYLDCEPLLDRKLPARIRMMKEKGVKRVNIASNASLLNYARSSDIMSAGLDEIYITLDSMKKDVFEAIRPGLKYEMVYDNIINFVKWRDEIGSDVMIRMQMVMQDKNKDEGEAFVEHWSSILKETDQVVVQKAHNWGTLVNIMKFGDENNVNDIPCIALWGTFCIHVDGEVDLCCMDTGGAVPIGNVASQTIAEVWSGDAVNKVRDLHVSGEREKISICDGCTLWRDSKHDRGNVQQDG
ncbi:radical SAM/SPASM domain-containing protein [Candidatus Omnitrophota bacterium]